jgi:hypothetical protein
VTAEVVVANKLGVALAADSAVSITTHLGTKTYNTTNKLFTLSKFHPVGAMFYGNSELNSIPWEILVKSFRSKLARDSRPRIEDYFESFLQYLRDDSPIGSDHKSENVLYLAYEFFFQLRRAIEERLQSLARKGSTINSAAIKSALDWAISGYAKSIKQVGSCPSMVGLTTADFDGYNADIDGIRDDVFKDTALKKERSSELINLFKYYIISNLFSEKISGFVVAGYGDLEIYPVALSSKPTASFMID